MEFPKNACFSEFIVVVHNSDFSLWKEGTIASEGMKKLVVSGKKKKLEKEIKGKIKKGYVNNKYIVGGINKLPGKVSGKVEVSKDYPLVSIASIMTPSPDWFTGVSNVKLYGKGGWEDKKVIEVCAFDAGIDDGNMYTSDKKPVKPQNKIIKIQRKPFLVNRKLVPVGTFTFTIENK